MRTHSRFRFFFLSFRFLDTTGASASASRSSSQSAMLGKVVCTVAKARFGQSARGEAQKLLDLVLAAEQATCLTIQQPGFWSRQMNLPDCQPAVSEWQALFAGLLNSSVAKDANRTVTQSLGPGCPPSTNAVAL